MIRIAFVLLLALCTASAYATSAGTGVAFVHGTGHQTDAYNDYWQPTMVNTVRQGLSNQANYTVINCDFERSRHAFSAGASISNSRYSVTGDTRIGAGTSRKYAGSLAG